MEVIANGRAPDLGQCALYLAASSRRVVRAALWPLAAARHSIAGTTQERLASGSGGGPGDANHVRRILDEAAAAAIAAICPTWPCVQECATPCARRHCSHCSS